MYIESVLFVSLCAPYFVSNQTQIKNQNKHTSTKITEILWWGYNMKSRSLFGTGPVHNFFLMLGTGPICVIFLWLGPVPLMTFSYGWDRSHWWLFHIVGTGPIHDFFIYLGLVPFITFSFAWDRSHSRHFCQTPTELTFFSPHNNDNNYNNPHQN